MNVVGCCCFSKQVDVATGTPVSDELVSSCLLPEIERIRGPSSLRRSLLFFGI